MSFAIVAEFPQGLYYGHIGEGQIDLLPSIDRVHSALLAAAGQGLRAVEGADGTLGPNPDDLAALEWLEENPPDGLALPSRSTNRSNARAYRDLGLLKPKLAGTRKVPKRDHRSVALAGSLVWVWESDPPPRVRDALDELCPDVAYLGQSDSPVRLRTESASAREVTHRRDPNGRISTSRPTDIDVLAPRPGRARALVDAHLRRLGAIAPTPTADRVKSDESDLRDAVITAATGRERYVPELAVRPTIPWDRCWIIPFDGELARSDERVPFSVAMHRTLVAKHGVDAPPLLTGSYLPGVRKPANRLAIQVVDNHPAMAHGFGTGQAFVVAVPTGADPGDVRAIADALASARYVRALGRELRLRIDAIDEYWDAGSFWRPPGEGLARVWQVLPAAVETRSQGLAWSLSDAATLSVALVWRDELLAPEDIAMRGDARYRILVERARRRGVEVLSARPVSRSTVDRYVHRLPDGLMPLPYQAQVLLGDLEPIGASFVAIGQSRHLGGGALVPIDVSPELVEAWRQR